MLLYAETHYPRHMPSRVWKAEPEIVFDLPWRLEPRQQIPVLIAVRDAHLFPIRTESVRVTIGSYVDPGGAPTVYDLPFHHAVTGMWWWRILYFDPPVTPGQYAVSPELEYTIRPGTKREQRRKAVCDNYRLTRHDPFHLFVAADPWPVPDGWHAGDAHVHTEYTRDQIEFGPPVAAIGVMSRATGCHWAALTDHSYDLDDCEHDYLTNDPSLPRWRNLKRDIAEDASGTALIQSSEISCENHRRENVHLLGLGITEFIPGSGDSAERPTEVRAEHTAIEASKRVRSQGGLAVAAHIGARSSLLERIVFRRGEWRWEDLANGAVEAVQVWNGSRNRSFERAHRLWVTLLLLGRYIPAVAGADSHGSFGRLRQITMPWLRMADRRDHLFGMCRTVVDCASNTPAPIVEALREGRSYLTDGPEIRLDALGSRSSATIGQTLAGALTAIRIRARSTEEFGAIERIGYGIGSPGATSEQWTWREVHGEMQVDWKQECSVKRPGYMRAEVWTRNGKSAFTNPVRITGRE